MMRRDETYKVTTFSNPGGVDSETASDMSDVRDGSLNASCEQGGKDQEAQ